MYKRRGMRVHLMFLQDLAHCADRAYRKQWMFGNAAEWIIIHAACSRAQDMLQFLRAKSTGLSAALGVGRTSTSTHPMRLQD